MWVEHGAGVGALVREAEQLQGLQQRVPSEKQTVTWGNIVLGSLGPVIIKSLFSQLTGLKNIVRIACDIGFSLQCQGKITVYDIPENSF